MNKEKIITFIKILITWMWWKCDILFPSSFSGCLRMFMEEITFFFFIYRLTMFSFMTIIKKNLNIIDIFIKINISKEVFLYLCSILFHCFCRKLMKFFSIELCSSTIIFLLNIFCITIMLLKKSILIIEILFYLSLKKKQ
jgi:hypothetical protein